MRYVDDWQWGSVTLMAFEINPKSGPPDFVIDVTNEGHWSLMAFPPEPNWEPREWDETRFALFLTNPEGEILLGGIYARDESDIRREVERCRRIFEPKGATTP
jgi:hypothetical protein